MKLIKEFTENVEFLVENTVNGKNFFIEGPFLSYDTPNRNKRIYSESVMRPAVTKYIKEYIDTKTSMGELNHPSGRPNIDLTCVSHLITSLNFNESAKNVIGKAKILDTPSGQIARNLMEGGVKLGVSSRGLGSVKSVNGLNHVQPDFVINTVDIVGDPSGAGCSVNPIWESTNWKNVDGNWIEDISEVAIDIHKKKINEAVALKEFARLMEKIKG